MLQFDGMCSNSGLPKLMKLIVYWEEAYLFPLLSAVHMIFIYINLCTFKNQHNCSAVLTFLLALELLALKDLYYSLIAIQLVMAFGAKTVGQQIDKLSKYWWHLEFSPDRNACKIFS